MNGEIDDQDRLMAALAWMLFPFAIIILLTENTKIRPFQRYHAVHSLAFIVLLFVVISVIAALTRGFGAILIVIGLLVFYWAYQAYQGIWVEVPYLTDFCRKQGWI